MNPAWWRQLQPVANPHPPARLRAPMLMLALTFLVMGAHVPPAQAQRPDDGVLQAREALRIKDRARLAAARNTALASSHPLAQWVAYWELGNRLVEAQQPELDAFYARWPGTYVEDRLRNDWLLELGKRRDWANFRAEFPRFRMNDDREVTCYWLVTQHLDGQNVHAAALPAWQTLRDADDGCSLLGKTLVEARVFTTADAWQAARLATEGNRPRTARAAAALAHPAAADSVTELFRDPTRFLNHPATVGLHRELALLGLIRLAAADAEAAAAQLDGTWQRQLTPTQAAAAWAHVAKQAAMRHLPLAVPYAERAWKLRGQAARTGHASDWSDELLGWHVRAALRLPAKDPARWPLVARATAAMSPAEQRDSAWTYWRARAAEAQAVAGADGDTARTEVRQTLQGLAAQTGFYAKLAAEELGQRLALPAAPAPLTLAEIEAARNHPGLTRGLQLIAMGLRNEGVREWNFALRGMADRELLAAAQAACAREVWDRCINTSERTKGEIDMAQRFPMPHRDAVRARAREAGVDPAFVFGLIRQESRFIMDARSHVGASGLMQLMPATARWTAQRIGLDYRPELINDRDANLRLGASYLKLVLDDFGGSQPMAAAAYNAGPSRPRRWREGPPVEPAAWAESIPFAETRDYVKKVLSNAVDYSLVMNANLASAPAAAADAPPPAAGTASSMKGSLGPRVGPRDPAAPANDTTLP